MKRLISLLAVAMTATITLSAADAIPEKVFELNKHNLTFSAPFTETKVMPKLKKETKKAGTLYFDSKTDQMLLSYTDPTDDYTLIKGGVMYLKRGNKEQKFAGHNTESRMAVLKSSLIYAMHGNIKAIADANSASIKSQEDKQTYTCTLTTDNAQKHGIKQLILVYQKSNGALLSLSITEGNGNTTTYTTSKPQLNEKLATDLFQIK